MGLAATTAGSTTVAIGLGTAVLTTEVGAKGLPVGLGRVLASVSSNCAGKLGRCCFMAYAEACTPADKREAVCAQ